MLIRRYLLCLALAGLAFVFTGVLLTPPRSVMQQLSPPPAYAQSATATPTPLAFTITNAIGGTTVWEAATAGHQPAAANLSATTTSASCTIVVETCGDSGCSVTCTALLTVGPVANIHMYDQDDVGPTANTYGCLKSTCGSVTGSVVPE